MFRRSLIGINVKNIITGKWKQNCYIITKSNGQALIIDPGNDKQKIENYIDNNDLNVSAILNTHAHYDHIGAVKYLKDKYHIPFFLHSADERLLKTANLYIKLFDGSDLIKIPSVDYFYDQNNVQDFINSFKVEVVHTPGHTQGGVCLFVDNCLFTGDMLLNGKIGRTDLPGGNKQILNESLKIISKISKQTTIYPGHGPFSTVGHELKYNNKFIQAIQ